MLAQLTRLRDLTLRFFYRDRLITKIIINCEVNIMQSSQKSNTAIDKNVENFQLFILQKTSTNVHRSRHHFFVITSATDRKPVFLFGLSLSWPTFWDKAQDSWDVSNKSYSSTIVIRKKIWCHSSFVLGCFCTSCSLIIVPYKTRLLWYAICCVVWQKLLHLSGCWNIIFFYFLVHTYVVGWGFLWSQKVFCLWSK